MPTENERRPAHGPSSQDTHSRRNNITPLSDISGQRRQKRAAMPPSREDASSRLTVSSKLVELAKREIELFHDESGNAFATVATGGHQETHPLRSRAFKSWLSSRHYESEGKAPGGQALADALGVLEGQATFEAPKCPVFVRVATMGDTLYLDLADPSWQIVEVTRGGWRFVNKAPVKFRRPKGLMPLPRPVRGGSITELRRLVNVQSDEAFVLLTAWLVGALKPQGPYPILAITGEQGSAKSTMSRMVRSIIDPSSAPLRTLPREERDLAIAARLSHCLAFDNLSGLPTWISDALCRLATGGGFATRTLYTDDEETIFDAQRPVLLNGIEDLGTRPDLLDRAIVLTLPAISESARRDEKWLNAEFERARPRIIGALLDGVVAAIGNVDAVVLERLPRMADFARWVTAAERAFGWNGTFLAAYCRNRSQAVEVGLESDPVAGAVRDLMAARDLWEGAANELLLDLEPHALETVKRTREWPKSPRALVGKLKRLTTSLRSVGICVDQPGPRRWTLKRSAKETTVATVLTGEVGHQPSEAEGLKLSTVPVGSANCCLVETTNPHDNRNGASACPADSQDGSNGSDGSIWPRSAFASEEGLGDHDAERDGEFSS